MSDISHNAKSIETTKLTKSYGRNLAIKDLSIKVVWGEILSVIGPNGSGKSTLIKIISGITRPDSGISEIAGINISKANNNIRRLIGVVTHDTLLYEGLTGFENLQFTARIFGLDRIEERIDNVTHKMHLTGLLHVKVGALSHGLQKRFSIARSLLHEPKILLMDEPDSGLDQESLNILDSIILEHSSAHHSVLITTHNIQRAIDLSNRIVIISKGIVKHEEDIGSSTNHKSLREIYSTCTRDVL